MKTINIILLVSLLSFLHLPETKAEVTIPRIFGSNMVLQQGMEIPIWGQAKKGERVSVTFLNKTVRTRADKYGKWRVLLPVQQYGGPHTMTIRGRNKLVLENIMIGEVWVCSGQSNMQWRVDQSKNRKEEIQAASHPDIRLFTVPREVAQFPKEELSSGEWVQCSPETIAGFSAVGYFFGRNLYKELNVPVGLIHSSWGGTVAETWTSGRTIQNDPDFREPMIELQQMDLEKYREQKMASVKEILGGKIPTEDEGIIDGEPVWSALDYIDQDWKTIKTPTFWEDQGYIDIDGIGWYRKELQLTENQTKTNITMHLGKIDDSDITFLNGIEIGKTENQYNKDRIYTIDKKYLRPGKNMIVVRVEDTGGNGGIWGEPEDQFLAIGNERIGLSGDWKFKISKASVKAVNVGPNSYPTLLFNAMINPIIPFGIKGVIWYQGESNAGRAQQYKRVFPNLIKDWRFHWGQGDFPFLFVSLANFRQPQEIPGDSQWAELREAQTQTLELPNTGMALAIDIGEANDIHPTNKQDVGHRLSLQALNIAYKKDLVHSGPIYESVEFSDGKATVSFRETGSGLEVKDKYGYLKGFTVAGSDRIFHWAQADVIDGRSVVVHSGEVKDPVAVRYGWADNPDDLNLYNKEGLPANPFRTDDWPGITK